MAEGLTKALATHLADLRFEDLPPATVLAAKRVILDGLGVILAASGESADVAPFIATAAGQHAEPGASILGCGLRTAPGAAAFANGAMSHALDFEDAFDLAPVHPNASLLPALFASVQAYGPISGREAIVAVAAGCDLACRVGLSLRRPMEDGGWYPPPILAAFGATAAAARCRQLTPGQIADAFSLLLCQVSCPGEIKHSPDTVIRAVREAFPAQAAITSVELAARGVRGFDAPLEGKAGFFRLYVGGDYDPAALLNDLGRHFWIDRLSYKLWPACRGTHAYIEAAQKVRADHRIRWQDIAGIDLDVGEVQQMLAFPEDRKRAPATAIDAKFSLPFTVATAIVADDVTLDSFRVEQLENPDVLALAQRVRSHSRPDWDRRFATAGALRVHLHNGESFSAEILDPLGSPDRPLSDNQLRAKFINCAARALRPLACTQLHSIADRIMSLEAESDMGSLLDLL
ncbi:MmgE/PrpD family protein [Sphingomonas piscis]|uniref:MmgE/PrpD family protein n=1 Tax=Sphingomonas piscis TaxID=2714943 RepID=A0A6G7YM39_9SPHN|nr:MmgE/PrpD family protein [Sphingomonas piscis]QIK77815.1 MmgE/PrpD family protein [Sphingomonas piscis]